MELPFGGRGAMAPETRAVLRLLLAGIGLSYLVAFLSLWVQVEGLVGSAGILPNEHFFGALAGREDVGFLDAPSLCWGSGCSDGLLVALCWIGVAAALLAVACAARNGPRAWSADPSLSSTSPKRSCPS